jgi:hypothetical protein
MAALSSGARHQAWASHLDDDLTVPDMNAPLDACIKPWTFL